MADKTIDQLTQATEITNDDLFVLQQSGVAKKLLGSALRQYIQTIGINGISSVVFNAQDQCVITLTDGTVITSSSLKGAAGEDGEDGEGVPTGGTTGQVLVKKSATDYDTEWQNQSGVSSWDDIDDKPFETIGSGLSVASGVLQVTGGGGGSVPTPQASDEGKFLSVVGGSATWVAISQAAGNSF